VISATWEVTRPPSRGLFRIRDKGSAVRDGRVDVAIFCILYSSSFCSKD
jgi:hypothetical protein